MQKTSVSIIDYIGNCNEIKEPIGHPIKIIEEYVDMLNETTKIELIIPQNYKNIIDYDEKGIYWLKHCIAMTPKPILNSILDVIYRIINIREAVCHSTYETLWFTNVDFYLGIAMCLFNKRFKGKKIIITTYIEKISNGKARKIKNFFYNIALKNSKKIIVSNNRIMIDKNKQIYIPDYYYDEEKYSKFKCEKDSNLVVCVGTMNRDKDIPSIIDIFKKLSLKLKIVGSFCDIDYFNQCSKKISDNITVQNSNLTYKNYYREIAKAKYIILPYNVETYRTRTSGVLLEATFLDTIPIAPKEILDFNNISGIGYEKIDEIAELIEKCDVRMCIKNNRESYCSKEKIREKIDSVIKH